MELLLWWLGLRLLARLLRAGDARAAGERIDADLDAVGRWLADLLGLGCGVSAVLVLGLALWRVLGHLWAWLFGGG